MLKTKPTTTVTDSDRAAVNVRLALAAVEAAIPGLQAPHPSTSRRIRGHRTVPRVFISSMIAAVEASELLQRVQMFDTDEALAALQFEAAFRSVVNDVTLLLRSLTYTIDARLAGVASKALQTYDIAKALARDPRNTDLVTHIGNLKRDLGRKGPRKKRAPAKARTAVEAP